MFCGKCGTKLSDKARFCKQCGTPTQLFYENKSAKDVNVASRLEDNYKSYDSIGTIPNSSIGSQKNNNKGKRKNKPFFSKQNKPARVIIKTILIIIILFLFVIITGLVLDRLGVISIESIKNGLFGESELNIELKGEIEANTPKEEEVNNKQECNEKAEKAYLKEVERQISEYQKSNLSEEWEKENTFAIEDVDGDGVLELITRVGAFGWVYNVGDVYGYNAAEDKIYSEGGGRSFFDIYDNGVICCGEYRGGPGGQYGENIHSVSMYNPQTDKYEHVLDYDSWTKSSTGGYDGVPFPDDVDIEGAGIVYYVAEQGDQGLSHSWSGEAQGTGYDKPISKSEFDERVRNKYFPETANKIEPKTYVISDKGLQEYKSEHGIVEQEFYETGRTATLSDGEYHVTMDRKRSSKDPYIDKCTIKDNCLYIKGTLYKVTGDWKGYSSSDGIFLRDVSVEIPIDDSFIFYHGNQYGDHEQLTSRFYEDMMNYKPSGLGMKLIISEGKLVSATYYS